MAGGGGTNDGGGGMRKRTKKKAYESVGSKSSPKNRNSITVLLLGDEGVGKSTLISTFVSRHFSEIVPGIMTRVRLPPDPSLMSCITTIVDSQGADAALLSAIQQQQQQQSQESLSSLGGGSGTKQGATTTTTTTSSSSMVSSISTAAIDNVDSIILVYDLDRLETFYRLENHWLPLIERCYNGELPVVIAGNKMDLFRQSSTTSSTASPSSSTTTPTTPTEHHQTAAQRSRQQIVSLLQRFKFVRQCIKCSAKNLLNVDEVFLKAQQSVLYPISPLYDLNTGRLTTKCRKAFTRIFRMYDVDNDGLLSNVELNAFQNRAFHVPLVEKDLSGWKKVVSKHNPTEERVIQDGKFTVCGFLAIFDVFISQNRLEVPWRILRTFGYDDDLELGVPEHVLFPRRLASASCSESSSAVVMTAGGTIPLSHDWKLSPSARNFLTAMFHQFDSNGDGVLSAQDILNIFSVVPEPSLPPWHSLRAPNVFRGCFSLPKADIGDMAPASSIHASTGAAALASSSLVVPPTSSSPSPPPLSASGITICSAASSSVPSVDLSAASAATTTSGSPGVGGSAIVGGERFQPKPKSLSFLDWMGQWHMISAISPSSTRAELYRLGHIEDRKPQQYRSDHLSKSGSKKRVVVGRSNKKVSPAGGGAADYSSILLPSKEIRTLILGSQGCGKTALLNYLCQGTENGDEEERTITTIMYDPSKTTSTLYPETSCAFVRMKRRDTQHTKADKGSITRNIKDEDNDNGEEFIVHLVFTEVPANDVLQQGQQLRSDLASMISGTSIGGSGVGGGSSNKKGLFDLVVLAFDCTDPLSFTFVKEMESSLLTEDVPRVFVGSKFDKVEPVETVEDNDVEEGGQEILPGDSGGGDGGHGRNTIEIANEHCAELDLEPPLLLSSSMNSILSADDDNGNNDGKKSANTARHNALEHLALCTFDINDANRLRSTPHAEQKRREAAKRRKLMWLGGIFSVSVAITVGVSVFWGGGKKGERSKDRLLWLKSLFSSGRTAVAAESASPGSD